jgi:hypothetical protein
VSYNTMDLPADPGLSLGIYTAVPGSSSDDALRLLASLSATDSRAGARVDDRTH